MLNSTLRWIGLVAGAGLVYYAGARLGLLLQLPGTNASPVWPPSGIGLAALLLFGWRVWPGILIAAFMANLLTLPNTPTGFVAALAIGVGNTAEQVVALWLLRRVVRVDSPFERPAAVFRFVIAGGIACAIASTNGATSLWLTGIIRGELYRPVWTTWWLGDLAGMLVLTPPIYLWCRTPRLEFSVSRIIELVLLMAFTAVAVELLFGGWIESPLAASLPFLFVVPSLLWAAFRFGPRETSSVAVVLSVIAIGRTWWSMGLAAGQPADRTVFVPFLSPLLGANESLLMLQGFICAIVTTAIMLAAGVNERNVAEQSLRESERRFRTIFEQAGVGVALIETGTGQFVRINQRYCAMVGMSAAEMTNTTFMTITHPEDLQPDLDNMRRLVAGAIGEFTMEKRLYRKDGATIWVNLTVSPTWHPGERPQHHIAIVEDITERKRTEQALRRQEDLYRSLVLASAQVVWTTAPTGEVVEDSPSWRALTGQTLAQFKGWGWLEAIHPGDRERTAAMWAESVSAKRLLETEYRLRTNDGRYCHTAVRAVPILEADGRVREWVGMNIDITDRKAAEAALAKRAQELQAQRMAALNHAQDAEEARQRAEHAEEAVRKLNEDLEQRVLERTAQLEAANKELDAFSYSVSHDLRAPLRAIDGFSRILLKNHAQELNATGKEYLQLVRSSTQHMGQLVDDLLAFARLSRQPVKLQLVEPNKIVRQCLADLRQEHEGRRVDVSVGELPACQGEPALLKQVWTNLLSNALKYTRKREAAKVEIGCRTDIVEGELTYYIMDNGVGFDMQYVHKLFGVFQRLHRAEDYEGTGVGLAIVQRIVHRHGGRVWAEAKPDQGATFYFTLGGGMPDDK